MYRLAYGLASLGAVLVLVGLLLLWRHARPAWVGSGSVGVGVLLGASYFGLRGQRIYAEARRWSLPAVLNFGAMVSGGAMGLATLWLTTLDFVSSHFGGDPPTAGPIGLLGVTFGVLAVLAVISDPD